MPLHLLAFLCLLLAVAQIDTGTFDGMLIPGIIAVVLT